MKPLLVLLSLLSSTFAYAEDCVKYSERVTIQGKLSRMTFPEQPNYESIKNGDRPASYFFITTPSNLCLLAGQNELEPAEQKIKTMQLIFAGEAKKAYQTLRAQLNKTVICTGSFMHASTGHHHSAVLFIDSECKVLK
ncbi:DUF4431 domain-containing protein [Undibacterium seohonense]|uniref:DUF4431 domain-containing protein n=1 Tax=Undibacterium seohonense TaxID=1344950 RepID=A0ABR6X1W9_9BURK|nr:DUF4431 domain-containing protein [Undibacterium seohonense]MBC3806835.1 DUF4431 domain-containing protein [Undibacterium seohonense]